MHLSVLSIYLPRSFINRASEFSKGYGNKGKGSGE